MGSGFLGDPGDDDNLVPQLPGEPGEAAAMMYEVGATLGKGSSGRVCVALERGTGVMVAVKIVPKSSLQPGFLAKYGRGVVKTVLELRHDNVVRVRSLAEDTATMYLAMDLCRGPELFEVLKRSPLPTPQAPRIIAQLLSAIGYLHGRGLVHRDIKPENFMFVDKGLETLKLIDLGSVAFQTEERSREVVGSVGFCAPEVFRGGCSTASDIFSAGVIVALALTGVWPHCLRPEVWMPSSSGSSTKQAIGSYRHAVLEMTPEEVRRWASKALPKHQAFKGPLAALLDPRPESRPEAPTARWLFADAAETDAAMAAAAGKPWWRRCAPGRLPRWLRKRCAPAAGGCGAGLRRPRPGRRRREAPGAPAPPAGLDNLRLPRGSLTLPGPAPPLTSARGA